MQQKCNKKYGEALDQGGVRYWCCAYHEAELDREIAKYNKFPWNIMKVLGLA